MGLGFRRITLLSEEGWAINTLARTHEHCSSPSRHSRNHWRSGLCGQRALYLWTSLPLLIWKRWDWYYYFSTYFLSYFSEHVYVKLWTLTWCLWMFELEIQQVSNIQIFPQTDYYTAEMSLWKISQFVPKTIKKTCQDTEWLAFIYTDKYYIREQPGGVLSLPRGPGELERRGTASYRGGIPFIKAGHHADMGAVPKCWSPSVWRHAERVKCSVHPWWKGRSIFLGQFF